MALVQGIHCLAHGNKTEARRIAQDIQQHQRLLVGTYSVYGAGAYAWYAERLPDTLCDWPQVLFDIDDKAIVDVCQRGKIAEPRLSNRNVRHPVSITSHDHE